MTVCKFKCDRCGLVFTKDGLGVNYYPASILPGVRENYYIHFCGECREQFLDFVKRPDKNA